MTQEDKELLIKDLCARLPHKLAVEDEYGDTLYLDYKDVHFERYFHNILEGNIKPYLLPLSSMTEEQKREYYNLKHEVPVCHYEYGDVVEEFELYDSPESFEYLIENHFDCRGLIEKGLAIDATGLNVY